MFAMIIQEQDSYEVGKPFGPYKFKMMIFVSEINAQVYSDSKKENYTSAEWCIKWKGKLHDIRLVDDFSEQVKNLSKI